jgi:protoporphyrinogen/coproporphyrinogen III oxidase
VTRSHTAPPRPRVVVVGGGIAGLAAAAAVRRDAPGMDVVVLEGSPAVGGKLARAEVGGVTVDVGAEAMLNRRPEAVDLARQAGLGERLVHPATITANLWSRGQLRPMPRTLMGVPTDSRALADSGVISRPGLARVALEPVLPPTHLDGQDVSVGWLVEERFGREVVDRLVEPLLGGVYAGRADQLSLRATMPALWPAARDGRSVVATAAAASSPAPPTDASPRPVFAGIRGGVGRLPLALVDALRARGVEVVTGATVRRLERSVRGWRVVHGPTVAEQVVPADGIVLAVPAASTSRLLADQAPTAAQALAQVPYASMAIVTVVLPRAGTTELPGSGFLVPPGDGTRVKAATFSSTKWEWLDRAAGDRLVLRASVGRYGQADELQHTDGELVRAVLEDLRAVLGPLPEPLDAAVTRWGGGLPQYTVGHLDRVVTIRRDVASLPAVAVCGAAYSGVGIPACIASGTAAADAVLAALAPRRG